jgi:DNA-binding NarL/FixJ family response regulator
MDVSPSLDALRVLLLADDPLVRAGLAHMVEAGGDDERVAVRVEVARDFRDLQSSVGELDPDAVLADLGVEPGLARERLRQVGALERAVVVLLPVGVTAAEVVSLGVRAALPRSADPVAIRAALYAAAQGLVVLDPAVLGGLLGRAPAPSARSEGGRTQELTSRELEVLKLLAEALPNKLIADRLGISDHTAKFHVNSVLSKLSAGSRTEAVVRAARMGLVTL